VTANLAMAPSQRMQPDDGGARRATVVMFWDYDTQWGADRSRGAAGPSAWGRDEFECTERIMALHAEHGIPACFAVVGAAAEAGERPYHDPAQVRAIHAAGHEIASHSHRHEWLPGIGMTALRETLSRSRATLEDCIGSAVTTFVPPFNQPFDLPGRLAPSWSERREVPRGRIGLARLCGELAEAGYRMARVAYRAVPWQLAERVVGRSFERPVQLTRIGGLTCLRLNTAAGFAAPSRGMVDRCVRQGGIAVLYGHPHSLNAGNAQDERHLAPLLAHIASLREAGCLRVALPRDLA